MENCLFCKIIAGQLGTEFVHEDERCVAFRDIHPKSRVHILLVPKKHIPTVADIEEADQALIGHLILVANKIARNEGTSGYKLLFNVGKQGGQEIFHVHLHLMGV